MKLFWKSRLAVFLQDESLILVSFLGREWLDHETILLRETPIETLAQRVASFLGGQRPSETLLILERSVVLQKELVFSQTGSLKESLAEKMRQLLPYSPKEMAYGLALETRASDVRGMLLAIPEKSIQEKLLFLDSLGLRPDEIVTDDQILFWLVRESKSKEEMLLLHCEEEKILALFVKEDSLIFSRSFNGKAEEGDFLSGISLDLLEKGEMPEKVLISGAFDPVIESLIHRHFDMPVERLKTPEGAVKKVPALFRGAALFGKYPAVSLLPNHQKIEKRFREKRRQVREALVSFAIFIMAVLFSFGLEWAFKAHEIRRISKEIALHAGEVQGSEKIQRSLTHLFEARSSKTNLLQFLKDLGTRFPASIDLKELRMEGSDLELKGETSSHEVLAETVESLEATGQVREARLEKTRLRKRLNEDYFEFEVSGTWNG